jgi:parallel beta-helix repeat protein
VNNGTYYENININKTITLVGENPETTIIDGSTTNSTYGPTVWTYGENVRDVVIMNFTIRGSPNAWGIYMFGTLNATIENNIISNNHSGIVADASDNSTFVNNTIANNLYDGLLFVESSGHIMKNNTVSANAYNFGIEYSAFNNDIDQSNLINGKPIYYLKNQTGIAINPTAYPEVGYLALINCADMTVENLNLTNNSNGILLAQTNSTILTNNTFANNVMGIAMSYSTNDTLEGNIIANNWQGITLENSPNNAFKDNNMTGNLQHVMISGGQLSDFLQDMDTSNTVDVKLVRYMINQTSLAITPYTFPNTGYLALVNCMNVTVQELSLQNNVLLAAFSQNLTIAQNNITKGGINLQHVSYVNASTNALISGDDALTIGNSFSIIVATNNVTQNSNHGIYLESSTGNKIIDNNIAENSIGVEADSSTNNTIIRNSITSNKEYGILLTNSNLNMIYHNNFIDNAVPRWQAVSGDIPSIANNVWDNGYPSGGNYWSDYTGKDQYNGTKQNANGSDAIGDTPYDINFGQRDHYPLISPYTDFKVTGTYAQAYDVEVVSNSSIANFSLAFWLSSPTPYLQPGQPLLLFAVTSETGTTGFCRVTIPRQLLNGTYTVLVDDQPVLATELAGWNNTYAYLYFTYNHSTRQVIIVRELPVPVVLLLFTTATALVAAHARSTRKRGLPKIAS